jgi:hypothetical protein
MQLHWFLLLDDFPSIRPSPARPLPREVAAWSTLMAPFLARNLFFLVLQLDLFLSPEKKKRTRGGGHTKEKRARVFA